jgi:DNA polymerase III delta prime subunit
MPAIIATKASLDEARKAYHALMLGTSPRVVVDQNNERVEFTAANKSSLYNYILQLEAALGTTCGSTPTYPTNVAPAGFVF